MAMPLDLVAEVRCLTWSFAVAHVDVPDFPMDRATRMYLLPLIPSTSTELRRSAELREYATAHLPPAAARSVESAVSDIELNARIRAHGLPVIDEWLRSSSFQSLNTKRRGAPADSAVRPRVEL
jgi:hypothetical protein